jgi:hypothetical protein
MGSARLDPTVIHVAQGRHMDSCLLGGSDATDTFQEQQSMTSLTFPRATKYPDLYTVYAQCGGPGGLKLAEFMAEKMQLQPSRRLLDVGSGRGYPSCFLAKEYGVFVVGIDPWPDRDGKGTHIDYLMDNAQTWEVPELVLGVQVGVPDTRFAENTFFPQISPPWSPKAARLGQIVLATIRETETACSSAGFEIIEADYAPDARLWWEEYAEYDPGCQTELDGDHSALQVDNGRWVSFGYVIARVR